MRLFIAFAIFVMSWEPSCDPSSSTGPTQPANQWDTVDPGPQRFCASYYGKVLDDSTGRCVGTATICLNGSRCHSPSGDRYSYNYKYTYCSLDSDYTVKITVSAPDYHPDSLVQNVSGSQSGMRHDFRLRRR